LGFTQDELAAKLDTKRQTIHKYETGIVTNMPLDKLEQISVILETTPAYLLGWAETKKPAHSMDELDKQIVDDFMQLSESQKKLVLAQIKAWKSMK
jgi:transcriptional regulator with XRE-family HTH domain